MFLGKFAASLAVAIVGVGASKVVEPGAKRQRLQFNVGHVYGGEMPSAGSSIF